MGFKLILNDLLCILPEVFFFNSILFLIVFGVFFSNNKVYKYINISNNLLTLAILILLIYVYLSINLVDYNNIVMSYLLVNNNLVVFFKVLIVVISIFIFFMYFNYVLKSSVFCFEFLILLLISIFSMLFSIMAYDFIIVYLSIELQTLCFYVLAAIQKKKNKSIEAAIKYFILGSFSSCILLLGIFLLYTITGSTNFKFISDIVKLGFYNEYINNIFYLSIILISVSFFFKLSVAPFHLWLPDVFDGVSRFVMVIFAILPKLALMFLFFKIYFIIFLNYIIYWQFFIIFFIFLSWFISILGAFKTKNINKIIAYSSIGNTGFILFTIIFNDLFSFLNYIIIYYNSMLNIFCILFILIKKNNLSIINNIGDLAYIKKINVVLFLSIVFNMFSLLGLPPLAGFYGKFFIFFNLVNFDYLNIFIILSFLISVLTSFYYVRIIKIASFNNTKKWIFLGNIDNISSYILSITLLFNFFYIFFIDFIFEFLKYLVLTSYIYI